MRDWVETELKLKIRGFDTMIKYNLSQKLSY